jgi:hypothetical protein
MPEPCSVEQGDDNSVTLTGGDPGEVIVRITTDAVEVLAYAVEWHGPHTPVTTGVPVAMVSLDESDLVAAVSAAVFRSSRCLLPCS